MLYYNKYRQLVSALLIAAGLSLGTLQAQDQEDADYLSLAALMIKDGQHLRAGEALDQVDTSVKKFDWKRYHTLRGLVYQNQDLHQLTIESFTAAIEAGQEDPSLHLYIARAWFALEEFDKANAELDKTGDLQNTLPAIWHLRIGIALKREHFVDAWHVLEESVNRFPAEKIFQRQTVFPGHAAAAFYQGCRAWS